MRKDPYFDWSQALLQIAIVLASVHLIIGNLTLLGLSGGLGGAGRSADAQRLHAGPAPAVPRLGCALSSRNAVSEYPGPRAAWCAQFVALGTGSRMPKACFSMTPSAA